MTWLTKNVGWIITLAALLIGAAVGYGRVQQVCTRIEVKADKEDVTREMDQIQGHLRRIEDKLDTLLIRPKQ